jgi:hypothetical protein
MKTSLHSRSLSAIPAACLLALFLAVGSAGAQQPVQCGAVEAFAVQKTDCTFYEIDTNLLCTSACTGMGMEVNNLGFRSTDGLLYGVELTATGCTHLVRVNPRTCAHEVLPVIGLPTTERFDSGDITPDGRWMFVSRAGFSPIYVVDLADLYLPALTAVPFPFAPVDPLRDDGRVNDWAYNPKDGRLYGGDYTDGQLAVVDFGVGLRVDTDVLGLPTGVPFGGAWFRANGHLVLYRNGISWGSGVGEMYELDVSNPASPSIVGYQQDVGDLHNDATQCIDCGAYAFHEQDCHMIHYEPTGSVDHGFAEMCGAMGMEVNNAGYWNGRIYAVGLTRFGNNGLLVIDPAAGCAPPVSLGFPLGWDKSQRFDAGDVTPAGVMFVNRAGLNPLYKIDLTQPMLLAEKIEMKGSKGYVHDWAYNPADGLLYGGDTAGQLAVMDTNGFRVDFNVPGLPSGIAYGGAWFAADGQLVLHRNNGELYRLDVTVPAVTLGPVIGRSSSGFNDATRCTGWVDP